MNDVANTNKDEYELIENNLENPMFNVDFLAQRR